MSSYSAAKRNAYQRFNRRQMMQFSAAAGAMAAGYAGVSRASHALAQDTVNISFYTPGGSPPFCTGFDTIAAAYEQTVQNVDIEETRCGVGDQSFTEFLLARIAAGDPPDSTILWNSPITLAARDALLPIDEYMASSRNSQVENWPPNVLASCQMGGQTFGLPLTAGSYALIYNEELFESKGLPSSRDEFPKTWDELRRFSKEITQWDGDTLVTAGMIPPRVAVELPIWAATNGGQLYDAENQTYTLNSEPVVELMNWAVEWLDDEYHGDINQVNLSGNWAEIVIDGRPPALQAGTLGIVGTGFWITGEFYVVEATYERWNAAQYPVGPGGTTTAAGYWPNWAVLPAGSEHPAEAFGFLDYIGVEGMTIWFENIPDLPSNIKVPPLVPQTTVERRGQEFADDITAFFRGQLDVAIPMWNSPIQDFADDQTGRALEQILAKASSPQDALTEAQNACQTELERVLAGMS